MKKKVNKKNWLIVRSIKFDKRKLKEAKEKGVIKKLPELCRAQLDLMIK